MAQLCTSCYSLHGPWLNGRLQYFSQLQQANNRTEEQLFRERGKKEYFMQELVKLRQDLDQAKAAAAAAKVAAERLRMELWHTKQRLAENRATEPGDATDGIFLPNSILELLKQNKLGKHLRTAFHPDKYRDAAEAPKAKLEAIAKAINNFL